MTFSDVVSRLKKHTTLQDKTKPAEPKVVDLEELYTLRARMLGVLIRDARLAAGRTVEEVGAHMNLPTETILAWEFGRSAPSLPEIELLAYFLQAPVSHFWGTETFMQQQARRTIDGQEYALLRDRMIGALIRSGREAKGLAPDALARQLGVSPEQLEAYELGKHPAPMTVLVSLASALGVNLSYFLESSSRVGEFLGIKEAISVFEEMPDDMREFITTPANHAYIRLAMILSGMPTESLRQLAEGLLDITL
jgi:transcriptional regulator with XRE-family HTH domain